MENQIQLYRDVTSLLLEQDLAVLENMDKRLRKRFEQGYDGGWHDGWDEGWQGGHDEGWQEAKAHYRVTYFCSVCGRLIEVVSDNERKAIRQYMKEHGWAHGGCVR